MAREYTVQFTKSEQVSIDYFLKNMRGNKAFVPGGPDEEARLEKLRERYLAYRKSWRAMPEEAISRGLHEDFVSQMKAVPMSVDIETAAVCDLACPHCFRQYIVTPDKLISDKLCYRVLDQAAGMGVPSIKFNWRGEPLLHPQLADFIAYAKKNGILETLVNTNAVALDEKKSRALIDAGLDVLIYSFDGGTASTYEKVRVGRFGPNRFEAVYENIARFHALRKAAGSPFPRTRIQMVLTPEAMGEVDAFKSRFEPIVDDVMVKAYEERGWGLEVLREEDRKAAREELRAELGRDPGTMADCMLWKKPEGNMLYASGRLPCQQPYQRLMVAYDGSVYMCCNDWGNEHPLGWLDEAAARAGNRDYDDVRRKIASHAKGFEGMIAARMPDRYNRPEPKAATLAELWDGPEINRVRREHIQGRVGNVPVCKRCTFRDTFQWKPLRTDVKKVP
ncbi:MAG: radical SAM/SPASM domain-containing protein [Elusimicrobiota bacterium]|jgi:MoaA/NifB/PqqE/SkfB family radical SAM enzyme